MMRNKIWNLIPKGTIASQSYGKILETMQFGYRLTKQKIRPKDVLSTLLLGLLIEVVRVAHLLISEEIPGEAQNGDTFSRLVLDSFS